MTKNVTLGHAHAHPLPRRAFLRYLGAAPLALLGCGRSAATANHNDARPIEGRSASAPPMADPDTCGPTAANIEGPFFKPGAPVRKRLAEADAPGVPLSLSGSVVGPDCAPLRDVSMEIWQADHSGAYDERGDRFRARLELPSGRFDIASIIPGRYLNGREYRPAHVHVKLAAAGFAPLTTQLYFPGDPFNAGDPFFEPSLLVRAEKQSDGALLASYQFALARG